MFGQKSVNLSLLQQIEKFENETDEEELNEITLPEEAEQEDFEYYQKSSPFGTELKQQDKYRQAESKSLTKKLGRPES